MTSPSLAAGIAARMAKQIPLQKIAVKRLLSDVNIALSEAKKADAKSCISFYGRLAGLTNQAKDLQDPLNTLFDDSEQIQKHKKDLPSASEILAQLKQLVDLLDSVYKALDKLKDEAKRIAEKGGVLAKIKLEQPKDKKLEIEFQKNFDAGMASIGVLTIVIAVYKKFTK
jgi:type II secretory pathway component PulF